jgi:hypothetical protein
MAAMATRLREKAGTVTARTGRFAAWSPWQAPQAPAGSYDPTIDAQQGAVNRGLGDQQAAYDIANARELTDYGTGTGQIQLGQQRGMEDIGAQRAALEQSYGRGMSDIGTQRSQADQDFQTNVAALTKNYKNLGDAQRQQQAKAGVLRGGAQLQAAAKRAENQGVDQQGLDVGHQRQLAALTTAQTRLGEDRSTRLGALGTAETRLGQDSAFQQSQLDLSSAPPSDPSNPLTGGRGYQDRTLALTTAQREAQTFGLDASVQRNFQATQSGWDPGARPANEYTDPRTGQPYRVLRAGKGNVRVNPLGQVIDRRLRRAA